MIKINVINTFSYYAKGPIANVLERFVLEHFSGGQAPRPPVSFDDMDAYMFFHHFNIFLTPLAHDKISTLKIKVLSSIFVRNGLKVGVRPISEK